MKKFITGFFALLVGITANSQNLRSNFLNGKSQAEIVESFNNLSTREKNDLWLEKIDQVLSQNIPHENLIILEQMKNFHVNKNLENFKA